MLKKSIGTIAGFFVLVVLILFALSRPFALTLAGQVLVHDDLTSIQSDSVVVLMGDPSVRPKFAANLVKAGLGKKLTFMRSETNALESMGALPPESDLTKSIALKQGLSLAEIDVVTDQGRASSTIEEGIALRRHFEAQSPKPRRLIFVTSWFHTSRANWILKKIFAESNIEINMKAVPELPYRVDNWWESEEGMITIFTEYIKYGRYIVKFAGRSLTGT